MPIDKPVSIDELRSFLSPRLEQLDKKNLSSILKQYGATDIDDLTSTLHRHFPVLTPSDLLGDSTRLKWVLDGNPFADVGEGGFEKNSTHDKTGHEKTPNGYDASPYSKTY
ncbi:hypothetical protein [Mesorhizobium sp. M0520]|uniref:hypothetical protein n=1 Tax=Mesorhizobium sp. M0520 TaxID=2956957 RepID=UPI00333CD030